MNGPLSSLPADHKFLGSIPVSAVGFLSSGELFRDMYGLSVLCSCSALCYLQRTFLNSATHVMGSPPIVPVINCGP